MTFITPPTGQHVKYHTKMTRKDRIDGSGRVLSVAECDSTLGEIVGRQLQGDFVARQHPDAVAAQATCEVGQNDAVLFELNTEQAAGEFF
jgi:butyrate kinase